MIGLFRGRLSQAASNELLARRPRAKVMKTLILAISAISLANVASASAQVPAEKNTIHQSAGDRDSRGTPKYYARSHSRTHYRGRVMKHDSSIHQSAGDRDSRGTPKN
jgi:hypothetical protein